MLPKFGIKLVASRTGQITLREAEKSDLRELNEIVNETGVNRFLIKKAPVSMKSTRDNLRKVRREGIPWIVCVHEGGVIGAMDFRQETGRKSHVCGFGMAFSKRVHGRGLAEATANACFAWLKKNGIEKIVAETDEDNLRARGFYKKLGFSERCILKKNVKRGKRYVGTVIIEKFL
ncbi:MAG: GNAT family N-acetyltransferase [Candidatus Micrarchaeota archaeon]|nr:GNAT family N-acetyltransferase [Candidatus Micrarchaeota archaeon]